MAHIAHEEPVFLVQITVDRTGKRETHVACFHHTCLLVVSSHLHCADTGSIRILWLPYFVLITCFDSCLIFKALFISSTILINPHPPQPEKEIPFPRTWNVSWKTGTWWWWRTFVSGSSVVAADSDGLGCKGL